MAAFPDCQFCCAGGDSVVVDLYETAGVKTWLCDDCACATNQSEPVEIAGLQFSGDPE